MTHVYAFSFCRPWTPSSATTTQQSGGCEPLGGSSNPHATPSNSLSSSSSSSRSKTAATITSMNAASSSASAAAALPSKAGQPDSELVGAHPLKSSCCSCLHPLLLWRTRQPSWRHSSRSAAGSASCGTNGICRRGSTWLRRVCR